MTTLAIGSRPVWRSVAWDNRLSRLINNALSPEMLVLLVAGWLLVAVSALVAASPITRHDLLVGEGLVGFAWLTCGLLVWQSRPGNHFGPVMTLVGFLWFNSDFIAAGSEWTAVYAWVTPTVVAAFAAWLMFAYPTGRIERRYERWAMVAIIAGTVLYPLIHAFIWPDSFRFSACNACNQPRLYYDPLALAGDHEYLALKLESSELYVNTLLGVSLLLVIGRRLLGATSAARRFLAPIWISAALAAPFFVLRGYAANEFLFGEQPSASTSAILAWGQYVTFSLIPLAFAGGLLQMRFLRGPMGKLIDELDLGPQSGALEPILGRALGDTSVRVYYRLEDGEGFTDAIGVPVDIEAVTRGRATTPLRHRDMDLGLLVHDPSLLSQPELVHSVCAAAGLALANERLQAAVRAHLAEVEASRARIVQAADAERRRIERNLHDGAQQRLVALRLDMMMSAAQVEESNPAAAEMLRTKAADLEGAIAELRELAHGIHPAVLTDEGLSAALDVLVQRARIPVEIQDKLPRRPPAAVEAVAYYVIAEGLTNIAKHALASRVTISLTWQQDEMVVVVSDNGVGGAHLDGGTGLQGLSDRVAAAGGTLEIDSPPGSGTTIRARFPVEPA